MLLPNLWRLQGTPLHLAQAGRLGVVCGAERAEVAGGGEGGAINRCEGPAAAGRGAAVCGLLRRVIPGPAA